MIDNKEKTLLSESNLYFPRGDRYGSFNGLRSYSAIGILLMHYLANIGDDYAALLTEDCDLLYGQIIPFLTNFVYMFFTVSAFSMCCGYFSRFQMVSSYNGTKVSSFDTEKFYVKRYTRIWPFFALLVMIDFIMKPSWNEFYQAFADLTLAFNFLPNPHIDVIGVGWFLGVVFLFYMIFPWFVFLLQSKKRAWFAMGVSVIFHVILVRYFLTNEFCTDYQISSPRHNIVYSFPFFMAGGLLYLYRNWIREASDSFRGFKWFLLLLSIVATCIEFTPWKPEPMGENILWIAFIFVLWVMFAMTGGIRVGGIKILDNEMVKFLSDYSMEIYLCHMVMFRVIENIQLKSYIDNPHVLYWTWCVVGIFASISFSWIVKSKVFPFCEKVIKKVL